MDSGCIAQFTKEKAVIYKNNKSILEGERNQQDGLYDVKLTKPKNTQNHDIKKPEQQQINVIIQVDKNKTDLAQFFMGHYLVL